MRASDLTIRLAEHRLSTSSESSVVSRSVSEIIEHPNYQPGNEINDIALIKLSSPVKVSKIACAVEAMNVVYIRIALFENKFYPVGLLVIKKIIVTKVRFLLFSGERHSVASVHAASQSHLRRQDGHCDRLGNHQLRRLVFRHSEGSRRHGE